MASTSGQDSMRETFQQLQLHCLKEEVLKWSREKKLKNLSLHSRCRYEKGCFCKGFKDQLHESDESPKNIYEVCDSCGHGINAHISHFESASDEELNFFLGVVMDMNLLRLLCREEDSDTKQVYYALSKKLAKCIQERKKPTITAEYLGNPPFEKPSISEAISNFVEYKYSCLPSSEYEAMLEISELFITSLNRLKLPSVKEYKNSKTQGEINEYEANYKRWLHFYYIPALCNSFQVHVTTDIFGRNFLQFVYDASQYQLLNKLESEGNLKVPVNKQQMIIENSKTFLTQLREEVFNSDSPIWNIDFKQKYKGEVDELLAEQAASTSSSSKQSNECNPITKQSSRGFKASPSQESGDANSSNNAVIENIKGDIAMDVVINIVKTIKDPGKMVHPELSEFFGKASLHQRMEEECSGIIKCCVIANSLKQRVSDKCLLWLIELQQLISNNLIDMPKEYITRILFDPKHKCIILLKNGVLIGGICFCVFVTQGFSEIVFCVVTHSEQSKRYGEYMMNKVKDYHIMNNILHLLTYADNKAVKFFERQGFSSDIKLEESRYSGYIKDYKEATFMHCELNSHIVYSQFDTVIHKQKEVVRKLIEMKQMENPVIYPGLTLFKNGVREIPCDAIPGLKEAGFRPLKKPRYELSSEELYQTLDNVLLQVKSHSYSGPFLEPVDEAGALIYRKHGKFPMDLQTMSKRLQKKYYCNKHLFIADMQRIFNNCKSLNNPNSEYYRFAEALEQFFHDKLKELGLQ